MNSLARENFRRGKLQFLEKALGEEREVVHEGVLNFVVDLFLDDTSLTDDDLRILILACYTPQRFNLNEFYYSENLNGYEAQVDSFLEKNPDVLYEVIALGREPLTISKYSEAIQARKELGIFDYDKFREAVASTYWNMEERRYLDGKFPQHPQVFSEIASYNYLTIERELDPYLINIDSYVWCYDEDDKKLLAQGRDLIEKRIDDIALKYSNKKPVNLESLGAVFANSS